LGLRRNLGGKVIPGVHRFKFVVPPTKENVFGIAKEHRKKKGYHLDGVFAAIDVVAEEEKARARRRASVDEDAEEIKNIAVDIPTM
jgi:hypothetical protein